MDLPTLVAATTPAGDAGLFTWVVFLTQKYASTFLAATWVTLYVAVIGTILGYVLGFFVGVVNQCHLLKWILEFYI